MKRSSQPARRSYKSLAVGALLAVAFTLLAISTGADRSASEAASVRAPRRASSNLLADAQPARFGVLTPSSATINVTSTAQSPGGGCTLGAAIQAANNNAAVDGCNAGSVEGADTIVLPAGTYTLTTVNNNLDFVGATGLTGITSDIIIQGAGSATTIIERDPAATVMFRLMAISNQSFGSLVLNDVTMRGGRASNDFPGTGGALFTFSRPATLNRVVFEDNTAPSGGAVSGPTFTVNHCTFTNNRATGGAGGAIWADVITVLRSSFTANSATGHGGAIYVGGGGVNSITDSSVSNNSATGASSIGGALTIHGTTTITRTSFIGNTANAESGAIGAGGTVNISDSVIANNSANEIGGIGAGSFIGGVSSQSLTIDRCNISNNAATGRSVGGVFVLGGNANITNSTISGNTAIMDGGGIRPQNGNLTLTNVTIDGNNTNGNGGGIWVNNQDETKIVTLNNVTLTGNNAGGSGGGLYRFQGDIRFKNTIIALNTSGSNSGPDIIAGLLTSQGYNLVGIKDGANFINAAGDRTGTTAAPINPLLGPLQANGGPTLTRALFGGSPALDAANPAVPGSGGDSCAAMDQRGTTRPQDGDGNGSQICDIGAVENLFPPPTPQWQPVVLTEQQIAEIKSWTFQGRTYAYVKLSFPDAGYRVPNWGQAVRSGNDFSADASVERFTGPSVQAVTTTAQIYDLGPLADGNYTFTFKNSGTVVKSQAFTVSSAATPPNPIDDQRQFVRQQYLDFLNREPDGPGWDFWTDNITKCNDPARRPPGQTVELCTLRQRETTSGAFFVSPEFQYTGYFVYRMSQGALGRQPKLSEFTPDAQFVGAGIIVNNQLSGAKIEQNKAAFAQQFVNCTDPAKYRCSEFKAIYDGLSNQQYVDKLFVNTGASPSAPERAALVNGLDGGTETRATVLQKVVDGITVISEGNQRFDTTYGQAFYTSEFNRAFVQLEYFGYMKRDPDADGYAFWLGKLNQYPSFVEAEMVLAFITSPEYRLRFGQP